MSSPKTNKLNGFSDVSQRWNTLLDTTQVLNRPLRWYFTGWRMATIYGALALLVPTILQSLTFFFDPTSYQPQSLILDAVQICMYVALALGLNVVVGYAGLLDLGYVAFFAIGSYSAAVFTGGIIHDGNGNVVHIAILSFWWVIPIGALIAAIFGILLGAPTLRLRGDYLAIVTLGFGEIVPILFKDLKFFGGVQGLFITHPAPIDTPFGQFDISNLLDFSSLYYFAVLMVILIVLFNNALRNSSLGRAWIAIREDELAASAAGVNLVNVKLMAFSIGATIGGIGGMINAASLSTIEPSAFIFGVSISVLVMIVLGGIGSVPGVILGAVIIKFFDTYLLAKINDSIHASSLVSDPGGVFHFLANFDFGNAKQLVLGIVLVLMILFRPQGMIPNKRRKLELQGKGLAPEEVSVVGEMARELTGEGEQGVTRENR